MSSPILNLSSFVACLLAVSCGVSPEDVRREDQPRRAAPGAREAPELALRPVMERAGLAFRRAGGTALVAHGAAHRVDLTDGAIRLTPVADGRAGTAIELETAAIARGGVPIAAAAGPESVDPASGAARVRRGDVTEEVRNLVGGIEQSWRFERAPAGSGDLLVEVAVRGQSLAA
ncbi:MAG TPA: hypothetical protein VFU21_30065, partial [Kofleriaceae bacterium]|nr:hypothetical protein [Kofleriaceae bacterium]